MKRRFKEFACAAAVLASGLATMSTTVRATTLLEFDSATAGAGVTPSDVGWTRFGTPMTNNGTYLLQDNTAVPGEQSGEYLSPPLPAGTFTRGGAPYGIEVRTRPITDVQFLGSDWPQMYLTWSDDTFNYNITIDKYSAANSSGTGDVVYGQGSFSPAITGIDWSIPHTVFIGYRSGSVFDFYLDGNLQSTIVEGSIARSQQSFVQNRVDFGDGTTANSDVAGEWYSVRVYDTNTPVPEPASAVAAFGLFMGIMARRSRVRNHV
jgi:hypothetical protein